MTQEDKQKCKAFTSLEQSRKLAEILPTESADMKFPYFGDGQYGTTAFFGEPIEFSGGKDIPCWSLAALLDILCPDITLDHTEGEGWSVIVNIVVENPTSILNDITTEKVIAETLIDACYEMILQLREQKLL